MKVYRIPEDQIERFIEETEEEHKDWVQGYSKGISKLLKEKPEHYKEFGPYWWALKKELAGLGYKFGNFLDAEWLEYMDYGSTKLNLAAAYLYAEVHRESCFMYASEHTYYYHDDDEDEDCEFPVWEEATYVLSDSDMCCW